MGSFGRLISITKLLSFQTSNDYKQGLTIASVSIRLISLCKDDSNRSPWVNLYHYFHNDFKAGVCGTFDITTDDVGLPDIIGLSKWSFVEDLI